MEDRKIKHRYFVMNQYSVDKSVPMEVTTLVEHEFQGKDISKLGKDYCYYNEALEGFVINSKKLAELTRQQYEIRNASLKNYSEHINKPTDLSNQKREENSDEKGNKQTINKIIVPPITEKNIELEFMPIKSKKNIERALVDKIQLIRNHTRKNWITKKVDFYDPIQQSMTRYYYAVQMDVANYFDEFMNTKKSSNFIQTFENLNKAVLLGATSVKTATIQKEQNSLIRNLNIKWASIKKNIRSRFNLDRGQYNYRRFFVLDQKLNSFEEFSEVVDLKRKLDHKEKNGIINKEKFEQFNRTNIYDTIMDIQLENNVLTKKRHIA